jgi:hypothetical protein
VDIINWLLSNLLTILLIIASPICLIIGLKIGCRRGVEKYKSSMTPDRLPFKQLIASSEEALRRAETISRFKNSEKNSGPEKAPWLILDRVAKLIKQLDNFYNPKEPKSKKTLEEFVNANNTSLMHALDDVASMLVFFKELLRAQRNNQRSLDNDVAEVKRLGGAHRGNQQGLSAQNGYPQVHPQQVRPAQNGYPQAHPQQAQDSYPQYYMPN